MSAYARSGAHQEAIRQSMSGGFFSESMFVRFVPLAGAGHLEGPSALAEATHRVVVVGGGVGGLVSALLLAARGLDVTLVEAMAEPGGKMRRLQVDGAAIDAGPTVFTMRWVFEQILADAGATLADLPQLTPLSVLARHAWRGPRQVGWTCSPSAPVRSTAAIGEFAGAAEARSASPASARRRGSSTPRWSSPTSALNGRRWLSMAGDLGPRGLAVLAGLGPFATLWRSLGRHFHDPRMQQLFARYATYCGASPWAAPATLMLVAQVEMDGVWAVDGGMRAVARALAALAERRGVRLRYAEPVRRIVVRQGRAAGVQLASGETLAADSVVFNGDVSALASGLLGEGCRPCGAAGAAPGAVAVGRDLGRAREDGGLPAAAFTTCSSTTTTGPSSTTSSATAGCRGAARSTCAPRTGGDHETLDLAGPRAAACAGECAGRRRPASLRFHGDRSMRATQPGAAARLRADAAMEPGAGAAHDAGGLPPPVPGQRGEPCTAGRRTAGCRRSSGRRRSRRCRGWYLAGGSVHPGPGVPMAAMSGRLAAATLLARLDSTSQVAPGGYCWWYVDALSDCGRHGLTLIAFVGSVFSPYYAWARRRGDADPADHVALNVCLYGGGTRRWTMTERGRAAQQRSAHDYRLGPSRLHWDGRSLTHGDRRRSACRSRAACAGGVKVTPSALCRYVTALDAAGRHRWGPIGPVSRVEVEFERPAMRWQRARLPRLERG